MSELDFIKTIELISGAAGGAGIMKSVEDNTKGRKEKCDEVVNVYGDRSLSPRWLRGFVYWIIRIAMFVAVAMIFAAILIALFLFWPGFPDYVARHGYNADTINKIGVGALILALLFGLVIKIEPLISLETFRHWLGQRNLERKLANRIKRGDPGYFQVKEEYCDKLAQAMAEKLLAEPGYLSSMLLPDYRPNDRNTLANELFIGEIFEAMMPAEFGGDWHNFRPVQARNAANGLPICSPQVILREEPAQVVEELAKAVSPRPSPGLKEEVATCLGQLKREWRGDALALLSPPRPRPSWILYLCLAVVILAPVPVLFQRVSLAPPYDKLYLGIWLFVFIYAAVLVLAERRVWTEWLAMRLKLRTSFETILKRLTSFPVYRTRKGSRVALAKFAYEYGLLDVPAKDLELGSSLPVALALIKTRAVYFSGADLREDDPDLWFFCELAMRRIARTLEKLLVEGGTKKSDLVEEWLPYNTVDGFLFIVGYDYCQKNSCAGARVCPFYNTKLCDSMLTEGFVYDRDQRHLKKVEW